MRLGNQSRRGIHPDDGPGRGFLLARSARSRRERRAGVNGSIGNIGAALCCGLLLSCATTSQFSPGRGDKYEYAYKMTYPAENRNLLFQDDSIIIQFKFDEAAIRFQLQNISESNLAIDWEKTSMNFSGRYFSVRHADNLYSDSSGFSSSVLLPPLGYFRDLVIPRDNIYFNGRQWVEEDLLPTVDENSSSLRESIRRSTGRRIGLLLSLRFDQMEKDYEFDFQVDTVKRISWGNYAPTQRIPAPPVPKHGVPVLDQVTTAIIAVGMLGFSAYVLAVKKNPPSE
jgi:hypothetical protein